MDQVSEELNIVEKQETCTVEGVVGCKSAWNSSVTENNESEFCVAIQTVKHGEGSINSQIDNTMNNEEQRKRCLDSRCICSEARKDLALTFVLTSAEAK